MRYQRGPFELRGLYTRAHVGDARKLNTVLGLAANEGVAEEMEGAYIEAGYDLWQVFFPGSEKSLIPFFRLEYLNTQKDLPSGFVTDRRRPRRLFIPGIQFKPHPNVVLKLDYRNIDDWAGNQADELSVGMGLVF